MHSCGESIFESCSNDLAASHNGGIDANVYGNRRYSHTGLDSC